MDKRVRSPNYPAISLKDALDKVAVLYKNQHTHAAPREVVAKGMGYNSLNGASASAISALHKYGLLDRDGDEIRVSDRAMKILHPHSPDERAAAIRDAASAPPLFSELSERFPGALPSEELLRNYLVRRGFAPGAVSSVILAYRETLELVDHEAGGYDSGSSATEGAQAVHSDVATSHPPGRGGPPHITSENQAGERPLARYDFEGGGHIRIMVGGNIETTEALDMVETLLALKRKEIERRKATGSVSQPEQENPVDDEDENNA